MVANHAHKKLARELMANSQYPMSFTDAMAHADRIVHAAKLESLRGISSVELSADYRATIARVSASLESGSDLVIFGLTGTGKSTAAYSVLEAAQLRSLILTSNYLEAAYLRSYLQNVNAFVQPQHLFTGMPSVFDAETVLIDELRNSFADQGAQLSAARRRIIVVHAKTRDDAQWRISRILPELELRSPVFLEAVYESKIKHRRLSLYGEAYCNPPVVQADSRLLSGANLSRIEVLSRRKNLEEVLGSATEMEDMLVLLRFAQLTIGRRQKEAKTAGEPELIVAVEESSDNSSSRPYEWHEARELVDTIAELGQAAGVEITVRTQHPALGSAARTIKSGRDLVVLGLADTGKSDVLKRLLTSAGIPSNVLLELNEADSRPSSAQRVIEVRAKRPVEAMEKLEALGIRLTDPAFLTCFIDRTGGFQYVFQGLE